MEMVPRRGYSTARMVKALLDCKHIGDAWGTRSIGKMVTFEHPYENIDSKYCFCVMGAIIVGVGYAKVDITRKKIVANVHEEERIHQNPWIDDQVDLNEAVAVLRMSCWFPSDQMVPISQIAQRMIRGEFRRV